MLPGDPAVAELRRELLLPPPPPFAPVQFPTRLAELGFSAHSDTPDGKVVAYILPPVVAVPAGRFLMGSDQIRDPVAREIWAKDEQPQHTVTLPNYEIARFPVTVAEYACFVRAGQREPNYWKTQLVMFDHPVVWVTWHDAVAYAVWLAERSGEVWRVPSEAEWEKAARGAAGRIYPWGDSFDQARCNTSESGIKTTTPVGSYPSGASPYGAQDMAGNVWEWTSSWYPPCPSTIADERKDADSPGSRVMRGGSWGLDAGDARSAYRGRGQPDGSYNGVGFRLVRAAHSS